MWWYKDWNKFTKSNVLPHAVDSATRVIKLQWSTHTVHTAAECGLNMIIHNMKYDYSVHFTPKKILFRSGTSHISGRDASLLTKQTCISFYRYIQHLQMNSFVFTLSFAMLHSLTKAVKNIHSFVPLSFYPSSK